MLGSHRTASRTYTAVTFLFSPTEAGLDAGHTARTMGDRAYPGEAPIYAAIRAVRNMYGPYFHAAADQSDPGVFVVTRPMDNVIIGYLMDTTDYTEQA